MSDAHVFGPTLNYLHDTAGFWRGWHRDVWSEMQRDDAMIPPFFVLAIPPNGTSVASAVWGHVVVANPWNLNQTFGDLGMLEEYFPQSQSWMDIGIPPREDGL